MHLHVSEVSQDMIIPKQLPLVKERSNFMTKKCNRHGRVGNVGKWLATTIEANCCRGTGQKWKRRRKSPKFPIIVKYLLSNPAPYMGRVANIGVEG